MSLVQFQFLLPQLPHENFQAVPLSAYYNGFTDSSVLNTYVMNYSSINLNNLDQIAESLYQIVK